MDRIITGHNSTFAIGGVSCSADPIVLAESFMININISGKNPAHRKAAKRYMRFFGNRQILHSDKYFFEQSCALGQLCLSLLRGQKT